MTFFVDNSQDLKAKLLIYFVCALTILLAGLATVSNSCNNKAYAQYSSLTTPNTLPLQTTGDVTSNITSRDHALASIGSSTTQVAPDKVILTLGVQTVGKTAKEAATMNSAAMNKIIEGLVAAGVRINETSTSIFSISPIYNSSHGTNNITGFRGANSVQIDSKNTSNISKWIDTAVSNGANSVESIYFKLSDAKLAEVKNNLIPLAIYDAKNKANIAAAALGLKVLGVKSITINEFGYPPPLSQQQSFGTSVTASF